MNKYCFSIVIITLLMLSCKKDEGSCTKEDFIGKWKGEVACNSGNHQNIGVDITAGPGDKVIVSDSIPSHLISYLTDAELAQSGCKLSGNTKVLGTGSVFSGSLSDNGQNLIIEFTSTVLGSEVEKCKYTLSPK